LQPQQEREGKQVKDASLFDRLWPYVRLLVEVVMILCIFVLSMSLTRPQPDDTGSLRKSPIPKCEPEAVP
jgi:hypothetical protein